MELDSLPDVVEAEDERMWGNGTTELDNIPSDGGSTLTVRAALVRFLSSCHRITDD